MKDRLNQIKTYEALVTQQEEYIQGESLRIMQNTENLQRKENEKLQWAADAHTQQMNQKQQELEALLTENQHTMDEASVWFPTQRPA
jgi:hypothetical protein